MPVASTASTRLGLHAGQPQVGRVAALARGAAAEEPGAVADGDHAHVGVTGALDRLRDAAAVGVAHVAAAGVGHVVVLGEGRADGRDVDPDGVVGVVDPDVRGEGVAAEHGHRLVGERADERDPGAGCERERRVAVGEQDDGLACEPQRDVLPFGVVEGEGLDVRGQGLPARVEQAEPRPSG